MTFIDSQDEIALPQAVRDELYKLYPRARIAGVKEGGNFPFLSNAEEVNVHILVHLRVQHDGEIGADSSGESGSASDGEAANASDAPSAARQAQQAPGKEASSSSASQEAAEKAAPPAEEKEPQAASAPDHSDSDDDTSSSSSSMY
jgi:hypothetical protein